MAKRKALTQKTRFEVFKRDKFICQYCGRSAPEVVLEVDHIIPVASGGKNDEMNLLTACKQCNAGKKHRELTDDSVISKQKKQLDDLQERREQIIMMTAWREGLLTENTEIVKSIERIINNYLNNYNHHVSPKGIETIKIWLNSFSYSPICDAIEMAFNKYPYKAEGWEFWDMVPRFANMINIQEQKPYLKDVFYVRGILKNRGIIDEWDKIELGTTKRDLEKLYVKYNNIENLTDILKALAKWCDDIDHWTSLIEQLISICETHRGLAPKRIGIKIGEELVE